MPVTKSVNGPTIITPETSLNTLDGQISGSTRDSDWSISEYHDPSIQIRADLSAAIPGAIFTLTAPGSVSGTVIITLPTTSGTLLVNSTPVVSGANLFNYYNFS